MGKLTVHTVPASEHYPASFAQSVHLTYEDEKTSLLLNQGYGVLYPEAYIREDDTLEERCITEPRILRTGDGYTVIARLTNLSGEPVADGDLVGWHTRDFVSFGKQQPMTREAYEAASPCIDITESQQTAVLDRWVPLHSVKAEVPASVILQNADALCDVKAVVTYSDGSAAERPVSWDMEAVKALKPGQSAHVRGTLAPVSPVFPLAVGYADPVFFKRNGSWYLLATNDNVDDIGLFIRKADTIDDLWTDKAVERCILAPDEAKRFVQTFWAPEFHVIGGAAYILFAVSGEAWGPQCHIMRLKDGCDPIDPQSWEDPIRVVRADGTPLSNDGITLDMTFVKGTHKAYMVWSYRRHIGTPKDTGSMLMIAECDEAAPWRITTEPVLLSRPRFGWENTQGTINNEGPNAIYNDGKIWLGYSGGDACGYFYVIGYHVAEADADLTDVNAWTKLPSPALASTFVPGIQGPGHHSFFVDDHGQQMIAYHAQERGKHFCRCTTYHRVQFARSGMPMLNVTGEEDIAPALRTVETLVTLTE